MAAFFIEKEGRPLIVLSGRQELDTQLQNGEPVTLKSIGPDGFLMQKAFSEETILYNLRRPTESRRHLALADDQFVIPINEIVASKIKDKLNPYPEQ